MVWKQLYNPSKTDGHQQLLAQPNAPNQQIAKTSAFMEVLTVDDD